MSVTVQAGTYMILSKYHQGALNIYNDAPDQNPQRSNTDAYLWHLVRYDDGHPTWFKIQNKATNQYLVPVQDGSYYLTLSNQDNDAWDVYQVTPTTGGSAYSGTGTYHIARNTNGWLLNDQGQYTKTPELWPPPSNSGNLEWYIGVQPVSSSSASSQSASSKL
jgi:hypothetical protein